jgi:6-pyruvoyltetrahydropterin/6-carboxytetrahydropterin synthase
MFVVTVQAHYDSAHFLRNYKGKCERLHGHRYVVELALASNELNEAGIAFDFVDVKKNLRAVADRLDHENLNDLPPFTELEPSAENQHATSTTR